MPLYFVVEHKGRHPHGQYYSVPSLFITYWCFVILIQYAPAGCVLFLLLEAHTTRFLVLEFRKQSCASLSCHFLTSKTHSLKAFTFYRVPCWERCVKSTEQLLIGLLFLILSWCTLKTWSILGKNWFHILHLSQAETEAQRKGSYCLSFLLQMKKTSFRIRNF